MTWKKAVSTTAPNGKLQLANTNERLIPRKRKRHKGIILLPGCSQAQYPSWVLRASLILSAGGVVTKT